MPLIAFLLLCCLGVVSTAGAMPGDTLFTQESAVTVYSEPNPNAPVVTQLDRARKLVEIKRQGKWVKVGVYRLGTSGTPTGFIGANGWVRSAWIGSEHPGGGLASGAATTNSPRQSPDRQNRQRRHVPSEDIELEISGTPGTSFRGSCNIISEPETFNRVKFKGITPKRYKFRARALNCMVNPLRLRGDFSKGRHARRLTVKLIVNGKIIIEKNMRSRGGYLHIWSSNYEDVSRYARPRSE